MGHGRRDHPQRHFLSKSSVQSADGPGDRLLVAFQVSTVFMKMICMQAALQRR